jgi:hypothetical protein
MLATADRHAPHAPPTLIRVQTPEGGLLLVAISRSTPGAGYLLEHVDGHWRCCCAGYRWRGQQAGR